MILNVYRVAVVASNPPPINVPLVSKEIAKSIYASVDGWVGGGDKILHQQILLISGTEFVVIYNIGSVLSKPASDVVQWIVRCLEKNEGTYPAGSAKTQLTEPPKDLSEPIYSTPPKFATTILTYLPGKYADDAGEDLKEHYQKRLTRDGKKAADKWIKVCAAKSLVSLAWRTFTTAEALRRMIGY